MTPPRRKSAKSAHRPNPIRDLLRQIDDLYVLDGDDGDELARSADHWSKLPDSDRDFALAHLLRSLLAASAAQADLQILMVQRLDAVGRALGRQTELLRDLVESQVDDPDDDPDDDDPDDDDPDHDDVALDAEGDLDEEPPAEEPSAEEPPARQPRRTGPRPRPRPRRKAEVVEGELVGEAQGDAGRFSHPPAEE